MCLGFVLLFGLYSFTRRCLWGLGLEGVEGVKPCLEVVVVVAAVVMVRSHNARLKSKEPHLRQHPSLPGVL